MIVVTVLTAKRAELSLGIMYRICVFQFKLLSFYRPRNLVISTSPFVLFSYPMFRLTQFLLLV
jgi:hypothetical protein